LRLLLCAAERMPHPARFSVAPIQTENMMSSIRNIAVALAVVGAAAGASAQTTTTTTTTTVERTGPLQLTPQQRTTVYRTVTRERRVTPAAPTTTTVITPAAPVEEIVVGRRVPSSVTLSPFPQPVVVETPALQRYRYYYVNNRLVLVDPMTSEVVDILDQ
jgi:hypothetical protein